MSYSLKPWETLSQLINTENRSEVAKFIYDLSTSETARAISRLSEEEQQALFTILSPEDAADVIEDISETQAAGVGGRKSAVGAGSCNYGGAGQRPSCRCAWRDG